VKLLWNAIVKNEAAIIDRCVESLLPYVDGAVVVDTGSTDGTPELIRRMFAKALLPVEIHRAPFENFEQARNEALRRARESKLEWDYLLLADADMELQVHRPDWLNGAGGLSYDLKQTAGALGYYNRRLVSRRSVGWYVGVTHEYLDIESGGILDGAEFIDHADGANRPEKFQRDINLLETALKTETKPGLIQRYHFYLASSYYDSGKWNKAAEHYKIRTALGGFDEEVWYAQMRYAHCLNHLGDGKGFIREMLGAYQLRPSRMEPLYDLAKYFRERGDNHASLLFSEPGLPVRPPKDLLFVNNYVYDAGLKEEFAICAYYAPVRRERGARICNELALNGSEQARNNLYWYLKPLSDHVAFQPQRISFPTVDDYVLTNPSIINHNGKPLAIVRAVNYSITAEGCYEIRGLQGSCNRDNPISTDNYLVSLDHQLKAIDSTRIQWERPPAQYHLVIGLEDMRLFEVDGQLQASACVREQNKEGWCEQVLLFLDGNKVCGWHPMRPEERRHEKNWMPWVEKGQLRFVYRLGTLVNPSGEITYQERPAFDANHISGGSQVVQLDARTWVALVHEARHIPGRPHNRYYQHRFVSFKPYGGVDKISQPFFFHDRQIEFAAGLALVDGKLIASYGVRDCEAWLATMDPDEVIRFIYKDAL